jgi:flagellar export protein FliJ
MKPRLTVVLDLRRAAEDAAKRDVGRLETERAELVAQRDQHSRLLQLAGDTPIAPTMREQLAAYLTSMRHAIADDTVRIAGQDAKIATARDILANAHREVKAIEAIRARDAASAMKRERQLEARANDEHAARIRMEALA